MGPTSAIAILAVFSTHLVPGLLISRFDTGMVLSPAFVHSSADAPSIASEQPANQKSEVGEDVPVPPVVQSFIAAYRAGQIKAALAVIFDPLIKLINESPVKTSKDKEDQEQALENFVIVRGMMRIKMAGPKADAGPPKEIQVLRSFRVDKDQVRVHLKITLQDSTFYMRFITQKTPKGEIIVNAGFGDADILTE